MSDVIRMKLQDVIRVPGGGGSDEIWLPEVDENGDLSWTKSSTSTAPETVNIKGPAGADGAPGAPGADGRGIVSVLKTATSANVDTYTITYTDGTTSTFNVTNGLNGADGADGEDGSDGVGIASVSINSNNHLIVTKTDGTTQDAGEIQGGGGASIDDSTPASNKVYSSAKTTELVGTKFDAEWASIQRATNLVDFTQSKYNWKPSTSSSATYADGSTSNNYFTTNLISCARFEKLKFSITSMPSYFRIFMYDSTQKYLNSNSNYTTDTDGNYCVAPTQSKTAYICLVFYSNQTNFESLYLGRYKYYGRDKVVFDELYFNDADVAMAKDRMNVAARSDALGETIYPLTTAFNGATITAISDTKTNFKVADAGQGRGIRYDYPLNGIASKGIRISITMERAQDDSNNQVLFNVYLLKDASTTEAIGKNWDIGANLSKITFERVFTAEEIASHTVNSAFPIIINTLSICSIDITVDSTVGIAAENVSIDNIKDLSFAPLIGKKAIFLGDSITALQDAFSWVDEFCALTGCTNIANVAVGSSVLPDHSGTIYDGEPTDQDPTNNVLGNQVQKIINEEYDAPDMIIIAIGANGTVTADDTRIQDSYFNSGALRTLANVDRTTPEGAFRYCNETLHNLYPNAEIFWCAPCQAAYETKDFTTTISKAYALEKLTLYGATHFIDTIRCGIHMANETDDTYGEYTRDGIHPNSKGAYRIARYNASAIANKMRVVSVYSDDILK